jgi:hypothetical protein
VLFGGVTLLGVYSEVWEWDGRDWTVSTPTFAPPDAQFTAMTWNPVTQRCLLVDHGTWEWDGAHWTQLAMGFEEQISVTWDEQRGRAVQYSNDGARKSTTLEWDGHAWTEPAPLASPPALAQRWLFWSKANNLAVLMNSGGVLVDAWLWDGTSWSPHVTTSFPFSRVDGMTYDEGRQHVVAWSAYLTGPPDSVWEWDGASWSLRQPSSSMPPARYNPAFAYDTARARVVLFGGENLQGMRADTWESDGVDWVQRTPATSPSPRRNAMLAYDVARSRVVLFGGAGPQGALGDTWEWDGTDWTPKYSNPPWPAPRTGASFAYDPSRRRLVLFGGTGNGNGPFNDTWEWDGATWTQRQLSRSPPPRAFAGMTYDEVNGRMMLFGGGDDGTWFLLP